MPSRSFGPWAEGQDGATSTLTPMSAVGGSAWHGKSPQLRCSALHALDGRDANSAAPNSPSRTYRLPKSSQASPQNKSLRTDDLIFDLFRILVRLRRTPKARKSGPTGRRRKPAATRPDIPKSVSWAGHCHASCAEVTSAASRLRSPSRMYSENSMIEGVIYCGSSG